ncbi:Phosphoribosylaminoimidazole carboxylase [Dacryopinax primogenitus]|uniref:Phosphoribosylaminoimidazole carboxylase n=1 Tax=Dacryopinax primogenitus (strain DJM 731) TaxID=1858805 RepID=M5FYY5_DACPD|nr:Phosphoribosylaminoimidazole carboxylase [Dacryopinax primogenitus]EJT98791.1 Phosphoribosylaminoimidazole carboxylase [Dacryopinax primogenitus]
MIGGGQLGRMLAQSASLLTIPITILDVGHSPAKHVIHPAPSNINPLTSSNILDANTTPTESHGEGHIDGSFSDPEKILELARRVDVLTVEIEHVNVAALESAERETGVLVQPRPSTIRTIQDKYLQKVHLVKHGVPVAESEAVASNAAAIEEQCKKWGMPLMLKSRTGAYDGRGNFVVSDISQAGQALQALKDRPSYAERWAAFKKEIAVMVVRSLTGEVVSYPAVETVHKESVCHLVFAPLRSDDPAVEERARKVAEDAVRTFEGAGVFGVEMFLMPDGSILVNEIAPRPHNSGHYTIEACNTSQYTNHLLAILGLPLGSTGMKVPSAAMLNILGFSSSFSPISQLVSTALTVPGATVHLYGKAESRKGRKMGHITVVGSSDAEVRSRLRPLLAALLPDPKNTQYAPPPQTPGFSSPHPLVGIIMGSDSDLPTMLPAAHVLDSFGVPYELTIVSAHRTAERMTQYARGAASRGLRVVIAGAGGAAHLPGMVAAMTALPVVGVPVRGSALDGVDSMWSIVQMPRGVPVATVAINNSTNAALLAIRIIGASMPSLLQQMEKYMRDMEQEVMGKVSRLGEEGWEKYQAKKH